MYFAGGSPAVLGSSPSARSRSARRLVEGATAERDDAPLDVDDREHQAVAEAIVVTGAALSRRDEAHLFGRRERDARCREGERTSPSQPYGA